MSYTDAELVVATQVAYLNDHNTGNGKKFTVGEVVDSILNTYGIYDHTTGAYVLKDGVSGADRAQFETALNLTRIAAENQVDSWRNWTVVDSCNRENGSGFYGCLIDTGDGNAIVGCRGSESFDTEQVIKDWVVADVGRLNNELTHQQADAQVYMAELYQKYKYRYDSYTFTGHSLGGSLATHSAITAPEEMKEKINRVISFDGPGFSDEYLKRHAEQIESIKDRTRHYEYSWVGGLLNQPDGIDDRIIKAHDDPRKENAIESQIWRHDTVNIEFDEHGNVMAGERGDLQKIFSPVSKVIENSNFYIMLPGWLKGLCLMVRDAVGIMLNLDRVVEVVESKIRNLYQQYLSLVVSGDYEVRISELCRMSEGLENVQGELERIAGEVDEIRRNLPYDSISAFYYKNRLGSLSNALESEGKKANKVAKVLDNVAEKYNKGDRKVSGLF